MNFTIEFKAFGSTVTRSGVATKSQGIIDFINTNKIEFIIPGSSNQEKLIITGRLSLNSLQSSNKTRIIINGTFWEFLELQVQNTSQTIRVSNLYELIKIESPILNILPSNRLLGEQLFEGTFRTISTSQPSPLGNSAQWKTAIRTSILNQSLSILDSIPYPDFSQISQQDYSLVDFTNPFMQGVLDLRELLPNNQLLF